jgi:hypothetical protein
MTDRPSKRLFPNPFYVVLLLSSTIFTVTTLGYLVSPYIQQQVMNRPGAGPGPGSVALAKWLDRHGPMALGVEFLVMLLSALLAMATDRWFPSKPGRPNTKST